MAKDRNTVAKRQREVNKKRKADEKRRRRAQKKQANGPGMSADALSPAEYAVLGVFRKYLMVPGKMLCLGNADLEAFSKPLADLTSKSLLVAESFHGGYSLTESGFAAMQDAP